MLDKLDFPEAELFLQGAHLTQFKDWLFLSSRSHFEEGKAIRGGIPVVFPWFGANANDPNAPQHGFARTANWKVESKSQNGVTLSLDASDLNDVAGVWPFEARISYRFGDELKASFSVRNLDEQTHSFEFALHTYFAVSDVSRIEVEGLNSCEFKDKTDGNARKTQSGAVRFNGEVDWVFPEAPGPLQIRDANTGFELRGEWNSAVVWNPGQQKAATLSDLGQDEWKRFVCVEVGAIAEGAVEVSAGQTWNMSLEIARL